MNEKKVRILLAEGKPGEAASALRMLYPDGQDGLELTHVSSVSTVIATLEIVNPEVIFLDLSLAQPDALEVVRRVHRSAPAVPLIILANASDKDRAIRSLSQGAQDYLIKGLIDSHTLERVLRAALEHNTLEGLADLLRDSLTGLYTRDGFLTVGERSMETAKSRASTLVLLCLKVENLAALRGGFGPSAVETSLCEVAKLLAGSFRKTDIVARVGESEFAALAVDAVEPSAPVLRQRLERRVVMHNQDRRAWGQLELRMSVRFWSAKEAMVFSKFLESVEAELRLPPVPSSGETALRKTVKAVEER